MAIKVDVTHCSPELVEVARRAYKAYAANSDGKTFDGRQMPTWEKLTHAVQSHWCAAVMEAARYAEELMRASMAKAVEPPIAPSTSVGDGSGVLVVEGTVAPKGEVGPTTPTPTQPPVASAPARPEPQNPRGAVVDKPKSDA